MNGECVVAISNPTFPELYISIRNSFCHSIDNDNSGSSIIKIQDVITSKYTFENIDTICFSPEDKSSKSISSPFTSKTHTDKFTSS